MSDDTRRRRPSGIGITKYQWLILPSPARDGYLMFMRGRFSISRGDMLNDLLSGIEDEVAKKARLINGVTGFWLLFSSAGRPVVCCLVRWLIAMVAVR